MKPGARIRILAALVAAACVSDTTGGGALLVVSQIDVQPPGASIILGATQQLTATPKTSSGITVPNRPVTWSSSDLGIATVSTSGLVTGVAVGQATITAHVDDVTADVAVNVTPKPVASVTVEPPQVALQVGGAQQLQATARDAQGQPLQDRPITFLSDNPAVASVSTLGLVVAIAPGNTTARATSEGRTGTSAITVTPRPASRLGFLTHPSNGTAGLALAPFRVAVQDDIGGTIPDAITSITLSIADNPGGSSLGGTVTVSAVAGIASFNSVLLDKTGAGYTLRASAAPLSPAVSNPFAIGAGAASKLAITTQPSPVAQSGVALPVQPVVQIVDAGGNAVAQAGVEITAQVVEAGGGLSGTLAVTTGATGAALFTNLVLTGPAGNYTLRFVGTGLTEAVSNAVLLSAGTAATLGLVIPPSGNAQAGVPFAQQPVVQVQDANGNPVAQAGVPVTVSVASGGTSGAASIAVAAPTLGGQTTVNTNPAGRAVFAGLSVSGLVGPYTLTFGGPGLTPVVSPVIALAAGPAAQVLIVTQPSSEVVNGSPFGTQPVVRLADLGGNPVAQAGVTITASLASGAGALSGNTTAVTDASGVATFTDLGVSGSSPVYRVSFGGPGLTPAVSIDITLVSGAPTRLFVVTQPGGAANGVQFTQQPRVQVLDQNGNGVAQAGIVVTAALASGAGVLGGTLTATTSASGIATFTDLMITGPAGVYVLRFTAAGLTPGLSANVGLGAGVPTHLAITTQPSAAAASGAVFAQQPAIRILDGSNNPVALAGVVVTAAIASGGGTLLGTVTATTNAFGLAPFTDLAISGLVGARTLTFTATGLDPVTSDPITITVGAPAALKIVTQPSAAATSGQPFAQQPVIQVEDGGGNAVAQVGINVTVAILTGGGTLGGTATVATAGNGQATFAGLSITGTAGNRTLEFTSPGLAPVTSGTIVLSPPVPTQLSVTTQPSASVQSGVAFPVQPVIQLLDAGLNPVPQAGVVITAAVFSGGGALQGTLTATTNASGAASFTNLAISGLIGNRVLRFTSPSLTAVNSATVAVTPGTPTKLALTVQPSPAASSGVAFPQQPVVRVQDAAGNNVTGLASFPVTATIASGSGATLGGGTVVATDGNGVAAFANLALTGTNGTFTLNFAGGGYTAAVSNNVVLGAGSAQKLAITTQPQTPVQSGDVFSPQPVIQLQDASNNPVAQAGVVITVALQSGNPALSGTLNATTNASGTATFTNLTITGLTGPRTLIFAAGGLVSITSNTITVTPGDPTALTITTQPSAVASSGAALATQPQIQLRDGSGNAVTTAGILITAGIGAGSPGGGSLTNATATTNAAGLATFSGLAISGTVGTYTLQFTSPGVTPVTSGNIALSAGAAFKLAITTQPSAAVRNDQAFPVQPVIRVEDAAGNPVAEAGHLVTAAIATGGGVLGTTVTATTNGAGVATFATLKITGLIGVRTLSFSSPSLNPATSNNVTVSAGTATQIVMFTQPPATIANGAILSPNPVVDLADVSGNDVDSTGVTIAASIASGGGSLGGTTPRATTGGEGRATFNDLTITGTVGNRTLQFTNPSLATGISNTVNVTAGPATVLTITQQPSANATNDVVFTQQPVVHLEDGSGNPVALQNVTVSLLGVGTLSGTSLIVPTNGSGDAIFSGLKIVGLAGTKNLHFVAGALSDDSNNITLSAGAATQMVITVQPGANETENTPFAQQPTVVLRDSGGNQLTSSGTDIVAELVESGTLNGTKTVATVNGASAFTDLSILAAGTYTIRFTSAGLAPVISGQITVTP